MKMTMRKMLAILATLAVLCTVLPLGALFSAVAEGDNLIANGDFASGIDGWYASGGTTIEAVDGALHGDYNESWGFIGYNISVKKNTDYTLTFDGKAINGGGISPKVNKTDWSGTVASTDCVLGADWQTYTWDFNSGNYDAFMLFFQSHHPESDGQEIWLDNVSVVEKAGGDTPAAPAGDNLIVNGDFETGDNSGWEIWQSTSISADAAKDGAYGAHLVGNGGWGGMLNQTIAVEAGAEYKLSFWINVNATGVNVQVKDGSGASIEGAGGWLDGNKKDTVIEWTFTAPDSSVLINFCGSGSAPEDVYVDNFSLVCLSGGQTPDTPVVPDVPAAGDVLNATFDGGETDGILSSSDISVADGELQFNVTKDWGNIYTELAVQANTDYQVSFRAKSKLGKNVWIKFHKADWTGDICQKDATITTAWKDYTFTLNSGDNTSLWLLVQFAGYAAEGETIWFDYITVTKVGGGDAPVVPDAPATGNVLVNGDFEDGSNGWELSSAASIVDDAHTGNGALQLENPGMWSGAAVQNVPVAANTNYVITMWVKRVQGTSPFNLYMMDAADNRNLEVVSGQNWFNTADKDWTEKTIIINTGAATEITIKWSSEASNAGIILIDDMQICAEGAGDEPSNATGLVVNGDFETGDHTGWEKWQSTTVSEEAAHNGKYGVNLIGDGGWGGLLNQTFAVEKGETYTVTLWVCVNASGANLQIKGADKIEGECDNTYLDSKELSGWTLRTFNVIANADEITLNFCGGGTNKAEDLYVDDITVVKKGELPGGNDDGAIKNSGFETGDLTGWNNLWNSCVYSFEAGGYEKSNYALNFESPGQWNQIRQDGVAVEPNTDYVVVGYVKNPLNVNIVIKTGDDSANINEVAIENDMSNKWIRAAVEFNSGDQTAICVLLIGREAGATAIFDNVQLYKKGEEPTDTWNEEEVTEGPILLDSFGVSINRPATPEANLIQNGSFEESEGGQWQAILGDTLYVVDDETAPEGNKSLFFNTTGVESTGKTIFYLEVEPETDYVFSTWIKGAFISDDNRFNATIGVTDWKDNFCVYGDHVFSNKSRQIVPTAWDNEWHLRSVRFNSGANSKVGIGLDGSLSQMWIDGIALYKVDEGVKYSTPKQDSYVNYIYIEDKDAGCADKDNLLPNANMNGEEIVEFWSSAEGFKNGFLSFYENQYEYGTSLKYTASSKACSTYTIKWIEVKPNTNYIFSVDMRIIEEGYGKLALLDGQKRDNQQILAIDFDKYVYGADWNTFAFEFNTAEFDRIGIAVMDGGGEALIDNMRLFESAARIEGGVKDDYVKPPYSFDDPIDPDSPATGVSVMGAVLAMALVPSSALVAFKLRRKKEDEE